MNKLKILSSTLVMTMAAFSALAEDAVTNEGKITGGAGTCTVDVLGVSDNNATANTIAVWEMNKYECAAGQYLAVTDNTVECTECPTGSYCPGGTYTIESENKGNNLCPTDYTTDSTGASEQAQCFTNCEIQCTQQACPENSINCTHVASSTTGKQYWGGTCDAPFQYCEIDFACKTGYNKVSQNLGDYYIANRTLADTNITGQHDCDFDGTGGNWTFVPDGNGSYDIESRQDNCGDAEPGEYIFYYNPSAGLAFQHFGVRFACSNTTPDVANATYSFQDANGQTQTLQITSHDKVTFGDNTGIHCWSQSFNNTTSNEPWAYVQEYESVESCLQYCNDWMSMKTRLYASQLNSCAANTINIDWNPDNGGEHTQNQCVYDGEVTLPTPDPVKPGYTFTGWKLVDGTTTE